MKVKFMILRLKKNKNSKSKKWLIEYAKNVFYEFRNKNFNEKNEEQKEDYIKKYYSEYYKGKFSQESFNNMYNPLNPKQ